MTRSIFTAFLMVAPLAAVGNAVAETKTQNKDNNASNNSAGNFLGLWNVDAMMNTAVKNISRRYNLDEKQEAYTQALMTRGVRDFLDKHEDDLRELIKEMLLEQGTNGDISPEMAKKWGDMALPMFYDAKESILKNNLEWREILNEDQRKIHDLDLRLMQGNFKVFEDRFKRWQDGNYAKGEMPIGGNAQSVKPVTPTDRPQIVRQMLPDTWELYVRSFIAKYGLDESQSRAAMSILSDCRNRAKQHIEAHQGDKEKADAEFAEARAEKPINRERLKVASDMLKEINTPIAAMFNELKTRLDKLPTPAQRAAAGEEPKAKPKTADDAQDKADDAAEKTPAALKPSE